MLTMTLSAEACTLNFILHGDGWCCHSLAFYQVAHNDDPRFQHQQLFLTEQDIHLSHHTDKVLHICFVFDGECFHCTHCAKCSAAKYSDDGHNKFSNPYFGKQFTCCDTAVILNHPVNLVFGLHHRCRGWLTTMGPITNVFFHCSYNNRPSIYCN